MDQPPSAHDVKAFRICIVVMWISYFLLFCVLFYNTRRFLIKQLRYKFFHIVIFYVLAYFILVLRILFFGAIWLNVNAVENDKCKEETKTLNEVGVIDKLATYLELTLGV